MCVSKCLGVHMGAQIRSGQLVIAVPTFLEVSGQLVPAKDGTFLNAYTTIAKNRHVRRNNDLFRQAAAGQDFEAIHTGAQRLVKADIPDFHEFFPSRRSENRRIQRRPGMQFAPGPTQPRPVDAAISRLYYQRGSRR